ncbi:choline kinase alpha-like protein, partial [Leptotrombidium deliense]
MGFGNKSYYCSIKNCNELKTKVDEHEEVIVRVFESDLYSKYSIKFSGEMAEPMIMERLSKIGIAPKVLGVFNKGIIVEFIPNKTTSVEDLSSIELSKAVIRKIALFNSQNMPISKKPTLLDKIDEMAKISINENTNAT